MEVHFTPEIEAQLNQLATRAGKDAEFIVQELIRRLIYHDEAIVALMRDSAAQK
jgi:predicted DNA-binding protein